MSRFESVLFDLDGTLVDSRAGVIDSLRHAVSAAGAEVPEPHALRWCVGPPLLSVLESLLNTKEPELLEKAYRAYVDHYTREGLPKARVYAGVPQMLERLYQSDLRLYLVTAKLTLIAQRMLKFLELDGFFDSVMGVQPDGRSEQKTQSIAMVMRRESLSSRSTAMVGDREYDIKAARHNGVFSVGVEYGYGTRQELRQAGADAICQSPAAVANLLISLS